jgi:hypothetical protein
VFNRKLWLKMIHGFQLVMIIQISITKTLWHVKLVLYKATHCLLYSRHNHSHSYNTRNTTLPLTKVKYTQRKEFKTGEHQSSSSSLHGLGESPVPASSIVVSLGEHQEWANIPTHLEVTKRTMSYKWLVKPQRLVAATRIQQGNSEIQCNNLQLDKWI